MQIGRLHEIREAMADDLEVRRIELLLLHQHLLAHADLAEVVQQPGVAKLAQLLAREPQAAVGPLAAAIDRLGQPDGERRDAARMARRRRIARFDRRDRRGDEPLEQPLDVLVEPAVLDRHRGLRRERAHQLDGALVVRQHLALDDLGRRQSHVGVALAVDELQHADDLVAVRLHRNHEHRLRAIAELLVEAAVLLVRHVVGQQIHVGDDERLAGGRRVPGQARVVDLDGELGERQGGERVVLRQLEAQRVRRRRRRSRRSFGEVERARVARRDAARLAENHLEQREQIALGRQRDADARQLLELCLMPVLLLGDRASLADERDAAWRKPPRSIARIVPTGASPEIAGEQIERENPRAARPRPDRRAPRARRSGRARDARHRPRWRAAHDRGTMTVGRAASSVAAVGSTGTRRSSTSSSRRPSGADEIVRPSGGDERSGFTSSSLVGMSPRPRIAYHGVGSVCGL